MDRRTVRAQTNIYSAEQVKRVLAGSGIDVASEMENDYMIFCPFHNNSQTPAGEVNKERGTFFCFSCRKVADLVELVMHTSARSYFESVRYIRSKESADDIEKQINKQLYAKPDFVAFDDSTLKRLYDGLLLSDRAKLYLSKRKISEVSWSKFSLGYSDKQDMVTIPVHSPDGIPIGFVGRSIEGKEFKNTPGLPKSKTLFNLSRTKSSGKVYVVESSFDAIRLDQVGFPAVATLGATVSNAQIELLQKYFNDIVVIADNDEAGGNMKTRIIEKLGSRVSVIQLEKQYKDIGDMEDESIKTLESRFDKTISSMLN
jgi:DNA primase